MIVHADSLATLYLGDCVEVMAAMPPESVDAIVTDPPYGLEFMGKEWDALNGAGFHAPKDEGRTFTNDSGHMYDNLKSLPRFGKGSNMQAWHEAWAREAFRVAKPGAHLLAFGGTRTYHRLASAIEDAGWEIRDCLVWAYASGFPKSHNIGNGMGTALKPAWEPIVMARKPLRGTVAANVAQYGTGALNIDATRIGTEQIPVSSHNKTIGGNGAYGGGVAMETGGGIGRWPANLLLTDPIFDGGVEGVVGGGTTDSTPFHWERDRKNNGDGSTFTMPYDKVAMEGGYGDSGTYSRFFELPKGGRSGILSVCPICGANSAEPTSTVRTPDGPTTPSQQWCDSCVEDAMRSSMAERESAERSYPQADDPSAGQEATGSRATSADYPIVFLVPKSSRSDREPLVRGGLEEGQQDNGRKPGNPGGDNPRNRGLTLRENVHPTVKPLELMRHLVRLVTPPGGTVLDCFLGSGTTAIAANMEGFRCIGIEREREYLDIAVARLAHQPLGMQL